mmetsp:Transcript_2296/g.8851  ORF Transcript_2296/g.8851 Transcript_2296/m.8851 type:complete len:322 (-) Transcript_2296:643-1608(-)
MNNIKDNTRTLVVASLPTSHSSASKPSHRISPFKTLTAKPRVMTLVSSSAPRIPFFLTTATLTTPPRFPHWCATISSPFFFFNRVCQYGPRPTNALPVTWSSSMPRLGAKNRREKSTGKESSPSTEPPFAVTTKPRPPFVMNLIKPESGVARVKDTTLVRLTKTSPIEFRPMMDSTCRAFTPNASAKSSRVKKHPASFGGGSFIVESFASSWFDSFDSFARSAAPAPAAPAAAFLVSKNSSSESSLAKPASSAPPSAPKRGAEQGNANSSNGPLVFFFFFSFSSTGSSSFCLSFTLDTGNNPPLVWNLTTAPSGTTPGPSS